MKTLGYGKSQPTDISFDDAVAIVKARLKDAGFGVLCEIDVAKTLKEKIGVDVEPYVILGACNPRFAHEALQKEPELGLLLPCNVVVSQSAGRVTVSAVDARAMLSVTGNSGLNSIADQVSAALEAVISGM